MAEKAAKKKRDKPKREKIKTERKVIGKTSSKL